MRAPFVVMLALAAGAMLPGAAAAEGVEEVPSVLCSHTQRYTGDTIAATYCDDAPAPYRGAAYIKLEDNGNFGGHTWYCEDAEFFLGTHPTAVAVEATDCRRSIPPLRTR